MKKGYKKDRIIVLHKYKFKESSAIIKAFGEQIGSQTFIANGLFKPKNIYLSSMDIFSINEIVFLFSENSKMYRVKESVLLFYPQNIVRNMEKTKYAGRILSIIDSQKFLTDTIGHLFLLTVSTLKELDGSNEVLRIYVKFLLNYLIIEGIVNFHNKQGIMIKKLTIDFFKYNNLSAADKLIKHLESIIRSFNE